MALLILLIRWTSEAGSTKVSLDSKTNDGLPGTKIHYFTILMSDSVGQSGLIKTPMDLAHCGLEAMSHSSKIVATVCMK